MRIMSVLESRVYARYYVVMGGLKEKRSVMMGTETLQMDALRTAL